MSIAFGGKRSGAWMARYILDNYAKHAVTGEPMPKEIAMRHRLPQFNHLFSSDAYSAGYYSYLGSETMGADTWAAFEETGDVWDKNTAEGFRSIIMATCNKTDRKEAYRKFRGSEPQVKYILKKRGFPIPHEGTYTGKTSKDDKG
jgi:peptidyl-dipeptidase Dcp